MDALVVSIVLLALGLGAAGGYLAQSFLNKRGLVTAAQKSQGIIQSAEEQQKRILLEAQEEALKYRTSEERDLRERRSELRRQERGLSNRKDQLERRSEGLEKRERSVNERDRELDGLRRELEDFVRKEQEQLEAISGLSSAEAREQLLQRAEGEIQHEIARRYMDVEQQAKDEADHKARRILASSIHRLASEVVSETTTAVVPLPNDEMKGRLIGREGRNIRSIEAATGVDLIIDDTPEAVMVSCFDPVRREVARIAIGRLVQDGRIHPARVEDVVKRAHEEVEETILKEGERAAVETGVRGMHRELIQLLGRLKYRYSYGENILQHSMEVGLHIRHAGRGSGCQRRDCQGGRPASRHRQSTDPRSGRPPRRDWRLNSPQIRGAGSRGNVHIGAPQRPHEHRGGFPGIRSRRCERG